MSPADLPARKSRALQSQFVTNNLCSFPVRLQRSGSIGYKPRHLNRIRTISWIPCYFPGQSEISQILGINRRVFALDFFNSLFISLLFRNGRESLLSGSTTSDIVNVEAVSHFLGRGIELRKTHGLQKSKHFLLKTAHDLLQLRAVSDDLGSF
jgi:hypothetical protein